MPMIYSFFLVLLPPITHTLTHADPSLFVLHHSNAIKLILTDIFTRKAERSLASIFDHTPKSFTTRSFSSSLLSYSFFNLAERRNQHPQQRWISVGNDSIYEWSLGTRFFFFCDWKRFDL
ncbi:hypothetical protein ACB092_03G246900 [Castanea dentata]